MWTFNITPVREPRMSRRDRFAPSLAAGRYFAFCNEMRLLANQQDFVLGRQVEVIFLIPMPESWSKKKKEFMLGRSHEQTPDTDNLLKAFCDALKESDCDIWSMRAVKFWWHEGKIIVMENNDVHGSIEEFMHQESKASVKSLFTPVNSL